MRKPTIARGALALLILQSLILPAAFLAQQAPPQSDINAAIRKEEMENSKVMHTLHIFTDLYGPRLTGSPNHENAAKWAAAEMKSWGFDYTGLESWDFGHPGWVNDRNTGLMISPVADTLTYEVLAWTPSTKGKVRAEAVHIITPQFPSPTSANLMQRPTQEELTAYLESVKSQVRGKIVLVGKPTFLDQGNTPAPKRISDEDNAKRYDPDPAKRPAFGGGRGGGGNAPTPRPGA